ncbi:hypothetical protein PCYB_127860, partial [Plasmodium cynomolgi strain B]
TPGLPDGSTNSTLRTLLQTAASNMNFSHPSTSSSTFSTPVTSLFIEDLPTDATSNSTADGLLANSPTSSAPFGVSFIEDAITSAATTLQNSVEEVLNTTVENVTNSETYRNISEALTSTVSSIFNPTQNATSSPTPANGTVGEYMSTLGEVVTQSTTDPTAINTTSSYINITTNGTNT